MKQEHARHIILVLGAALAIRLALFDLVGIWGDYGFYIYDSRLILQGQTPFVDFLGRSPVFIYLFTWTRGLIGHPIPLLRVFIIFWWLATSLPVYLISKEIYGHREAIAAMCIFLLIPFSFVYGMWANTQGVAAFFAATAILLLVKTNKTRVYGAVGVLLGIAYLSRRSIIVVLFAVFLFTWYHELRQNQQPHLTAARTAITNSTLAGITFLATLLAGYAAIVGWNPTQTLALFEIHTGNLFLSYGRGGYPLLGVNPTLITNEVSSGRIPIFNDLCQTCGSWTARTFAKTILVALPAVGIYWAYIRDWTDQYFTTAYLQYMYGILAALTIYAVVMAIRAGYYLRTLAILAFVGYVILAYLVPRINRGELYGGRTALILIVLVGFTTGYLYRNRVLHTYYFMDFWPYLSILGGMLYTRYWDTGTERLPQFRSVLAGILVISILTSGVAAHPLANVAINNNADGWFTMDNLGDFKDDINERTEPGDVVFTTSPAFLSETHAKLPNDNPRIHMVAVRYEDTGPGDPLYRDLIRGLDSGAYTYVILTRTTRDVFRWNETAREVFFANYCRVASADALYQRADGQLYKYQPEECDCNREPSLATRYRESIEPDNLDRVRANPENIDPMYRNPDYCRQTVRNNS